MSRSWIAISQKMPPPPLTYSNGGLLGLGLGLGVGWGRGLGLGSGLGGLGLLGFEWRGIGFDWLGVALVRGSGWG